jgi:hypothetical protein
MPAGNAICAGSGRDAIGPGRFYRPGQRPFTGRVLPCAQVFAQNAVHSFDTFSLVCLATNTSAPQMGATKSRFGALARRNKTVDHMTNLAWAPSRRLRPAPGDQRPHSYGPNPLEVTQ